MSDEHKQSETSPELLAMVEKGDSLQDPTTQPWLIAESHNDPVLLQMILDRENIASSLRDISVDRDEVKHQLAESSHKIHAYKRAKGIDEDFV